MRILKLKLRGATGIRKGLGLDEIEIDFTQFNSGLVALTGRNGCGKTTIMENLHPYRQMVSRDGSLQSHFFLKDSYRILEFEFNGDKYEAKILIDALTGASEAYLAHYENSSYWVVFNDGKLTSYDAELEKLLGTPELFFNSVFSGQKSKGIAELKPAERRKLFYELLNLNVYEVYLETAKSELKKEESKLAEIEGEKRSIDERLSRLDVLTQEADKLQAEKVKLESQIEATQKSIDETTELIRSTEIKIAGLQEKIKQNEELKLKSAEKQIEKNKLQTAYTKDQFDIREMLESAKEEFEETNPLNTEAVKKEETLIIAKHGKEKKEAELKAEISLLTSKLHRIDSDIKDCRLMIAQNEKLIGRKEEIESAIIELERLKSERDELNKNKTALTDKQLLFAQEVTRRKENYNKGDKALDILGNELDKLCDTMTANEKELERLTADIQIIERVPCDKETGSSCQFITKAFNSVNELNLIQADQLKLKDEYEEKKATFNELDKELTQIKIELEGFIQTGEAGFNDMLKDINAKIQKVVFDITQLNKTDWLKLRSELNDAEKNIATLTEKKLGLEEQCKSTNELLAQTQCRLTELNTSYEADVKKINAEIEFLNSQVAEQKKQLEKQFADKLQTLNDNYEANKQRIENEIKELESKIDNELGKKLDETEHSLFEFRSDLFYNTENKQRLSADLTGLLNQFSSVTAEIDLLKADQSKLNDLLEKKSTVEKEIKDWTLLTKAFDKTGIPVLKLENSGIEITSVANELLSIFENKFRIVFETTKLKSNKKDVKETFDINIVEDDGVTEISNKSGGERVWIETALRLAISILVKEQGKNLETLFLDESDGALDVNNAHLYLEMLRNAHDKAKVHNTFVITHRPELIDLMTQKVILRDGYINVEVN